jgi:H/ACA ribonucleoprotein complex subunit 4
MIDIQKIQKEKPIQDLLRFGIINIDKPQGPTSFSVSNYIMKELKLNKTSHAGTLDPQVSGVLPILLGRACRLSDYFMHRNKTYVGIMRLHDEIDDKKLNEIIEKFLGKIMQLPPVRSRVKRQLREREVISFKILERDDKDVLFETEVQAGTYIRKLCDDMGKEIGGAHMLELRRTKAGLFNEHEIYNLYQFEKAVEEYKKGNERPLREIIVPAEIISQLYPIIQVNPKSLKKILTGKPLFKEDIRDKLPDSEIFVLFNNDIFIGVYHKSKEGDIIARPDFILN